VGSTVRHEATQARVGPGWPSRSLLAVASWNAPKNLRSFGQPRFPKTLNQ
jgi:hypothetical protein